MRRNLWVQQPIFADKLREIHIKNQAGLLGYIASPIIYEQLGQIPEDKSLCKRPLDSYFGV